MLGQKFHSEHVKVLLSCRVKNINDPSCNDCWETLLSKNDWMPAIIRALSMCICLPVRSVCFFSTVKPRGGSVVQEKSQWISSFSSHSDAHFEHSGSSLHHIRTHLTAESKCKGSLYVIQWLTVTDSKSSSVPTNMFWTGSILFVRLVSTGGKWRRTSRSWSGRLMTQSDSHKGCFFFFLL